MRDEESPSEEDERLPSGSFLSRIAASWLFLRGQRLAARGAHERAISCYRRAIESRPEDAFLHLHLALALSELERYPEAVQLAEEGVRLAPRSVAAHLFHGRVLYDAGDLGGAIAAFQRAVELNPKNDLALGYLRLCRWLAGDDPHALEKFAKEALPESTPFLARLLAAVEERVQLDQSRAERAHSYSASALPIPLDFGHPLLEIGKGEDLLSCFRG